MEKKKVFVGLSGGVDSAVSAALLKEQGYDVVGLFVWIALPGYPCSAGEDRRDALRVATHLQIPFLDIDLSKEYRQKVFESALDSYRRGETPNPDTLCNREIKFGLMYDYARARGADYVATGHYARTENLSSGETHLLAGIDEEKDQSYFLWMVPEKNLAHTLFPVGHLQKTEVRALARKFQLPNAGRKDSQGLCFLGGISMEEALLQELKPEAGEILNESGEVIGRHRGALLYTIGQRHGFEVFAHSAHEERHYVVAKDMAKNTITVSAQTAPAAQTEAASAISIGLREENWIGGFDEGPCEVRFRYRQKLIPAVLERSSGKTRVKLLQAYAIPVGQSLVAYRNEQCLGGGVIGSAGGGTE